MGLRRTLERLLPRHSVAALRFELRAALVRLTSRGTRRRLRGRRGLVVNVGAGSQGRSGWENLDLVVCPGITAVWDCRTSLPFDDGAVRGLFTEHFLEHLDRDEEVPVFLGECRRVLEPGGTLRIVVPDMERYLRAYVEAGWDEVSRVRGLGDGHVDPFTGVPYRTKMELVNYVFRQKASEPHKYGYDFSTLELFLKDAGFAEVESSRFGTSRSPEICLDQVMREPESLYVEAH